MDFSLMGKLKSITRDEIFGNWKMLSPEGVLMCRLSTKKAQWYVERGLADLNEEERTIQLKFAPNGLGDTNPYLLEDREAICVVCGTEHELTNHHVVPSVYRRHLPESYKSHNSHDTLLICERDHDLYERHAWERKKRLQNIYAPISRTKRDQINSRAKAVRAAYALVRNETREHVLRSGDVLEIPARHNIPEHRRLELLELIAPHCADLSQKGLWEFVREARRNPDRQDPIIDGESVMKAVVAHGDTHIRRFIEGWREHFVETTQPQFLSENWAIDWHKGE
jgi:exonuclease 3'-5' domain-containing protein 2